MAKIVGGIGSSHVPSIGKAYDLGQQEEPDPPAPIVGLHPEPELGASGDPVLGQQPAAASSSCCRWCSSSGPSSSPITSLLPSASASAATVEHARRKEAARRGTTRSERTAVRANCGRTRARQWGRRRRGSGRRSAPCRSFCRSAVTEQAREREQARRDPRRAARLLAPHGEEDSRDDDETGTGPDGPQPHLSCL